MNFARLLVPLTFILCSSTWAQEGKEIAQVINYHRGIPGEVKRWMPREAKSLFWGTFTPEETKKAMGIHFFFTGNEEDFSDSNSYKTFYLYRLDVFNWEKKRWDKFNSSQIKVLGPPISSLYPRDWSKEAVQAKFYWVDNFSKTIPLISLYSFSQGDYGSVGTVFYTSFAKGWTLPSVTQSLPQGGSNSGDDVNVVSQDANGLLLISHGSTFDGWDDSNGARHYRFDDFKWNGRKFVVSPWVDEKLKKEGNTGFAEWRP